VRISHLIHQSGINPDIAAIDLEMVKMKMQDPEEGAGWSAAQCESGEIEYKRFLHLCQKHGKGMVPTNTMDTMWHYHILDTRAYHADCQNIFGGYMHHYPYFGMRGEQDAQDLSDAFDRTKSLYMESFGEPIIGNEHTDCNRDCQGRCWHACKS
jgi:hypothetical protein